jgi:hypothetical protein
MLQSIFARGEGQSRLKRKESEWSELEWSDCEKKERVTEAMCEGYVAEAM